MIDAKTALLIAEEKRNLKKQEALRIIDAMIQDQIMAAVSKGNYSCTILHTEFGDNWDIFTSEFIYFRHRLEKLGFSVKLLGLTDFTVVDSRYVNLFENTSYHKASLLIAWNKREPEHIAVIAKKKAWWKLW